MGKPDDYTPQDWRPRAALVLVINCVLVLRTLQTDGKVLLGLIDRVIVSKGLKSRSDDLHPQHSVRQAICFGPTLGIRLELNSAFGLLAVPANRMQDHCGVAHGLAVVVLENNKLYCGRLAGRLILITGSEQSGNHEQDKKDREQWARYLHDPCILGNRTARRNAIGFRRTGPSTSSIPTPFSNTCLETIFCGAPRRGRPAPEDGLVTAKRVRRLVSSRVTFYPQTLIACRRLQFESAGVVRFSVGRPSSFCSAGLLLS